MLPTWVADHQLVRFTDKKTENRPHVDQARQEALEALKDGGYDSEEDHLVADIDRAEAVTSWDTALPPYKRRVYRPEAGIEEVPMHRPVLDLDFPAMLVPSSTPGHFHLYLDKPMKWTAYHDLLGALAEAGIIEEGYAEASQVRGYSAVRVPWLKKGEIA